VGLGKGLFIADELRGMDVSMGSILSVLPLQYRPLAIVAQAMASIEAAIGFCDRVFFWRNT